MRVVEESERVGEEARGERGAQSREKQRHQHVLATQEQPHELQGASLQGVES